MVLIRPRGGDFVYTADELQVSTHQGSCQAVQTHAQLGRVAQHSFSISLGLCCVQVMLADIQACSELGVHGVVIGCLQPDGSVDVAGTQQLVNKARDNVGVHRYQCGFVWLLPSIQERPCWPACIRRRGLEMPTALAVTAS